MSAFCFADAYGAQSDMEQKQAGGLCCPMQKRENKVLQWMERIGQISVTCLALLCSDLNIKEGGRFALLLPLHSC